jgi:Long-chain acyl-CoA synthetases (AMP-forming)
MFLKTGDNTAIIEKGRYISYNEVHKRVKATASLYSKNSNSKAAIYSENRSGWVYAFYSAWYNEHIVVPIDFMANPHEVAYMLNDCTPEIVFCSTQMQESLNIALKEVHYSPRVIVVDEIENSPIEDENVALDINPSMDKTALIIYTSGTTGNPKGVMLSFENLMVNISAVTSEIEILVPSDTALVLLPLHHIFPLMGSMVATCYLGARMAFSPSMASEDIIRTLQDYKVSTIIGVPRLYAAIRKGIMDKINQSIVARSLYRLAAKVNSYSFSRVVFATVHKKFGGSIRYLVSGGAALDPAVARDFQVLGFTILEGFGMTEAAPMITFTRPGKIVVGSAGAPVDRCTVDFADGEIIVKGPNIMQGYYNRPEETAEVLKDGWLYTGDLGYLDKDNYIHITGRKKEIIVLSNGKNINPSIIETEIEEMSPLIKEIGVFQKGDQLSAIIVPNTAKFKELGITDIESTIRWEVIDKYNKETASYKKIISFTIYNGELPRTRLEKLQRFKLAELATERKEAEEKVSEVKFKEYLWIKDFLEKEKMIQVRPNDHLEMDLGLDSLDKVSLQMFLTTTFGVKMELSEILGLGSVLKLSEYIREKKKTMKISQINWAEILREKTKFKMPSTWVTGSIFIKAFKFFFSVYFRLRNSGQENVPEGPCIIAPNHQSYFDGIFVAAFLKHRQIRKTFFYAKAKHVNNRFLKFLANKNNIIVVDIDQDLKESIQKMGEALKTNNNIMIFPEGTRTRNGELGDFKKTFAILSCELNIPIVPVSIKGAFEALPRGSRFPKPFTKVEIDFLPPVYPEGHTYDTLAQQVQNNIEMFQR